MRERRRGGEREVDKQTERERETNREGESDRDSRWRGHLNTVMSVGGIQC